jgi:hypothetical protein
MILDVHEAKVALFPSHCISAAKVPSAASAGLRHVDLVAQHTVSLADADAESLHRGAGLDDLQTRPVAHKPGHDRPEFHEGVTASACQIVQCFLDFVVVASDAVLLDSG